MFGYLCDGEIFEYVDCKVIDFGYLDGCGLEIVWVKLKVDVFFIYV